MLSLLAAVFLKASPVSGAPASSYSLALRRYPYLTDAVGQSVTVNWATDRSRSSGSLSYGKVGSESCTAHSVAATKTTISVNGVSEYQWKAQLNLQTGTSYCYRVYLGTSPTSDLLGSDPAPSFRTQLSSRATTPFSFVVIGDWGQVDSSGRNTAQAKLMSLIASSGARFVVTTGDNGYPGGNQANYGDLIQTGLNISAVFGPSFWKVPGASLPLFMTQGNHGLSSTDTNHPALINWPEDRAVSTSGGRYKKETYCCLDRTTSEVYPSVWYAFNAETARFYILQAAWSEANVGNATAYKVDYDYHWAPGTAQYEWLKADLAAHPSGLKFVFLHYPIYSDNPTETSDTFLQGSNRLEGLLKQNGVAIAFTGHAHIYERNRASAAGVINYITGGGGATLGSLGTCTPLDAYAIKFTTTGKACGSAPVPTSVDQIYHFLKVTVDGTNVTVTPINALGQSFDVMNYSFAVSAQTHTPSASTNLMANSVPVALPITVAPDISTPSQTPTPTLSPTATATATATLTCTPATPSPTSGTPTTTQTATPTPFRTQVPQITPAVTDTATATATPSPTETMSPTPTSTNPAPGTGTPTITATATATATVTPTCTPTPQPSPSATNVVTLTPGTSTPPTVTPVVTVGPGGALTFISEADASVLQALPTTNFGAETTLSSQAGPGVGQISFVRFTVKGTHDTIRSVKLRLFATNGAADGPGVYLADNHWIESGAGGMTWNNQPDLWSGEIDNRGTIESGTWVDYDVSSMVMGDGTYTFALIADGSDNVSFSSREGSAPPQLVVTFSP